MVGFEESVEEPVLVQELVAERIEPSEVGLKPERSSVEAWVLAAVVQSLVAVLALACCFNQWVVSVAVVACHLGYIDRVSGLLVWDHLRMALSSDLLVECSSEAG